MAKKMLTLPSGAQITENDYAAIQKEMRNDTIKNVFAITGAAALVGLFTGYVTINKIRREVES